MILDTRREAERLARLKGESAPGQGCRKTPRQFQVPTRWISGGIAFNNAVQFGATGDDLERAFSEWPRHFVVRGRLWRVSNPDLEPDIRVAIFAHISITLRSVTGIVKDLAELVDKLALAQGCPQVLAMGTMVTFKLSERLAALEASGRAQPD